MSNPGPASTVTYPAITPISNIQKEGVFLISITPAAVGAATVAGQAFSATGIGLVVGDIVSVSFQGAQTAGVGSLDAYVSAADQITIRFVNPTAGSLTPAAGNYAVSVQRPQSTSAVAVTNPQLSW